MRRVLVVSNNLAGGGAEKVLLTLLSELRPPEYVVDLLLIKNKGVYMNDIPAYVTVKVMIDVGQGDRHFPIEKVALEDYWETSMHCEYDVEIAFLEDPPTKLVANHKSTSAKKIAWVHTDLKNVHWTYPYYSSDKEEKETYEAFDQVVFVSDGAMQAFHERFGVINASCTVITNPTNIDEIQEKAKEYKVMPTSFTFCNVASLCARKGHSRLLYAMGRLIAEGYDFHLNLVGDGEDKSFLISLSHLLGIEDRVHFIGFQHNPYPYISSCDAFISSSISEGFPLVICEALCLEKPIIATQCVGNQDVLQNGQFGLMVNNTEEGLYCGMKQIISDNCLYQSLERKAKLGCTTLQYTSIIAQILNLLS